MSDTATNDTTEKPVKVNKWETNAVKNALDDACKKVWILFVFFDRSKNVYLVFQRDTSFYRRLFINGWSSLYLLYCMFVLGICFGLWLVKSISEISFHTYSLRCSVSDSVGYFNHLICHLGILFWWVFWHFICNLSNEENSMRVNSVRKSRKEISLALIIDWI